MDVKSELRRLAQEAHKFDPIKNFHESMEGLTHAAIYGAGNAGRNYKGFFDEISRGQYTVSCFLDKRADEKSEYLGLPVYKADDERLDADFRENTQIFLALLLDPAEYDQLTKWLRELGQAARERAIHVCDTKTNLARFNAVCEDRLRQPKHLFKRLNVGGSVYEG